MKVAPSIHFTPIIHKQLGRPRKHETQLTMLALCLLDASLKNKQAGKKIKLFYFLVLIEELVVLSKCPFKVSKSSSQFQVFLGLPPELNPSFGTPS